MVVGFTNSNVANISQPKQQKIQFGVKEKVAQKKQEFSTAMKDNDKRYNFIGALAGLGILTGLGIALVNNQKVFNIFERRKKALKKYLAPSLTSYDMHKKPHGGPDVDITKGPTAIHDAWTDYINKLKNNRKNNANIFKYYKEVFAENSDRLDELERIAKERTLKRGDKW